MTDNHRFCNRTPRVAPEIINRLLAMADAAGLHLVTASMLELV